MGLLEQASADARARSVSRQRLVDPNEGIENSAFARRQRIETHLQPFLQVFQDEGNETHVSDFVLRKSFPHVFRTTPAQMYDRPTAAERPHKTNHEPNP